MNYTPEQYILLKQHHESIIEQYQEEIGDSFRKASKCHFPGLNSLRKANPSDIIENAVIWYLSGDEGPFWKIVDDVINPNDKLKTFLSDDGCQFGLEDAYVRI